MTEKKEFPMVNKKQSGSGCGCGCLGETPKNTKTLKPEADKAKK